MPYEIVHTIGATIYAVFIILFIWMSRIPRTNPGSIWWAAAMFFALAARLSFFSLQLFHVDTQHIVAIYWALNILEKLFLVSGLIRFFGLPLRPKSLWISTLAVETWILVTWLLTKTAIIEGAGVAIFNAGMLCYVAWISYRKRYSFHPHLMTITSVSSILLALHWATAFIAIDYVPSWLVNGFLVGTLLVLIQYLSLLAAVLLSFQQRLLAAESKALDMAFQDPLTGLSNQRYVDTLFEQVLALANRPRQLVAVIYIDLDNFKPINDQAGHGVGDEVLKVIARRLRKATRGADICARIGGDEFVAICTQMEHEQQVHIVANKILSSVTTPIEINGSQYRVGASIGISIYPLHGDALPTLLKYADEAMYGVKRKGKNGYQVYEPAMR